MNRGWKLLATFLLLILSSSLVTPALAHTSTSGTSPANGSTVPGGIQTVSVSFNETILNLSSSSELVLTNSSGAAVELGCLEVSKKSLNAEALLTEPGTYTAVWRTVAKDGHPLTGKFSFKVSGSANEADFVSCAEANAPEKKPEPKVESSDTVLSWLVWPIAGCLVLALGVFAWVKRSKTRA